MFGMLFLLIPSFLFLLSCQENNHLVNQNNEYDLNEPDTVFVLPEQLKEVSGITYWKENLLAAIQDENGIIFLFDLNTGTVVKEITFAGNGDYEGITASDDTFFIIKSDGTIFTWSEGKTERIRSGLNKEENAEGIAYDSSRLRLLIAGKKTGSIHFFDLKQRRILSNLKINLRKEKISPSGICIHPNTNDLYVLSDNKLLIMDSSGAVRKSLFLKPSLFSNPEGITFSPEGNLFISNEGNGNQGTILLFKKRNSK